MTQHESARPEKAQSNPVYLNAGPIGASGGESAPIPNRAGENANDPNGAQAPVSLGVLIVEDDTLVGMGLRSHLERLGHTVIGQVSTAESAVQVYKARQPDLILMDVRLDHADGIALAETLLKIERRPIIIVSAYSDPGLITRAAAAGVFGYIVKPVTVEALGAQIEIALSRHADTELLRKERADLQLSLESRKHVEKAKGILMRRLNLVENEAHRRLQMDSQRQRVPIGEIARRLIESEKLLGG